MKLDMSDLADSHLYYEHDQEESVLPPLSAALELAQFEALTGAPSPVVGTVQEKLAERVKTFAESQGFTVIEMVPGALDSFTITATTNIVRLCLLLPPGHYYENAWRMSTGKWQDLWIYGITGADGYRPRIVGLRKYGKTEMPSTYVSVGDNQRLAIENVEFAASNGNTIVQDSNRGESILLLRNCFIHSNGQRALFRDVKCPFSPYDAYTFLISCEFKHSSSHLTYINQNGHSVISGCKYWYQSPASHGAKNISLRTLVQDNDFETVSRQRVTTNAWVDTSTDKMDVPSREFGGSTPYDGMSGAEFAVIRRNKVKIKGYGGGMLSLQNRTAMHGSWTTFLPTPGLEYKGIEIPAVLDHCSHFMNTMGIEPGYGFAWKFRNLFDYKNGDPPGSFWTEEFWDTFEPRKTYLYANEFIVTSSETNAHMLHAVLFTQSHPTSANTQWEFRKRFPVPAPWDTWIVDKLGGRVTEQLFVRDNIIPPSVGFDFTRIVGIDEYYGVLPDASEVIVPLDGDPPDPESIDPMLRLITGVELMTEMRIPPTPAKPTPEPIYGEWKEELIKEHIDDTGQYQTWFRHRLRKN